MVLLEVLIALLILGVTGASAVGLLIQSASHVVATEEAERRAEDESRLMAALSLLSRSDLEQRLGIRAAGPYDVSVVRLSAELYSISVGERGAESPRLVTMLYRPAR